MQDQFTVVGVTVESHPSNLYQLPYVVYSDLLECGSINVSRTLT